MEYADYELISLPTAKNKALWNLFGFKSKNGLTIADEFREKVYCRVPGCLRPEMAYCGNTTNLMLHLQRFHPQENADYCALVAASSQSVLQRALENGITNSSRTTYTSPKTPTYVSLPGQTSYTLIDIKQENDVDDDAASLSFFNTSPLATAISLTGGGLTSSWSSRRAQSGVGFGLDNVYNKRSSPNVFDVNENITKGIVDFIIMDRHPCSIVDGQGFRKMFAIISPDYPIPSAEYCATEVAERYATARNNLKEMLMAVDLLALTLHRSKCVLEHYNVKITAHYLDEEWQIKSRLLDSSSIAVDTSADQITDHLRDKLQFWGLIKSKQNKLATKVLAITHNSDGIESFKGLGIKYTICCVVNAVYNAIATGLKTEKVCSLVSRVHSLVSHINCTATLTTELRKAQLTAGISANDTLDLISIDLDDTTSWTSVHRMMERLVSVYNYVSQLVGLDKCARRDVKLLSDKEINDLKELCTVLSTLSQALKGIEGETHCSLSLVGPLLRKLQTTLTIRANDESSSIVNEFKSSAMEDLNIRYCEAGVKALLDMATLLDVRTKHFKVIDNAEERQCKVKETKALVCNEATAHQKHAGHHHLITPSTRSSGVGEQPVKKKQKTQQSQLLEFLQGSDDDADQSLSLEQEVDLYCSCQPNSRTEPLSFWRDNSSRYPLLSSFARQILTIAATSDACNEETRPYEEHSTTFAPGTVNQIVFLQCNSDLC